MKRLLLFAALLAWSGMAGAVIYKWVDAQGKLQYGDRPPDGVHAQIVALLGTHVSNRGAPPARAAEPAPAAAKAVSRDQPSQDDASLRQAVNSDVTQSREEQCADAQDRYKKLIEGRRIFKTDANGERQYLSAEEIDTARLNAKRDIDATCNSPT